MSAHPTATTHTTMIPPTTHVKRCPNYLVNVTITQTRATTTARVVPAAIDTALQTTERMVTPPSDHCHRHHHNHHNHHPSTRTQVKTTLTTTRVATRQRLRTHGAKGAVGVNQSARGLSPTGCRCARCRGSTRLESGQHTDTYGTADNDEEAVGGGGW